MEGERGGEGGERKTQGYDFLHIQDIQYTEVV
jgi:hypothetical protein